MAGWFHAAVVLAPTRNSHEAIPGQKWSMATTRTHVDCVEISERFKAADRCGHYWYVNFNNFEVQNFKDEALEPQSYESTACCAVDNWALFLHLAAGGSHVLNRGRVSIVVLAGVPGSHTSTGTITTTKYITVPGPADRTTTVQLHKATLICFVVLGYPPLGFRPPPNNKFILEVLLKVLYRNTPRLGVGGPGVVRPADTCAWVARLTCFVRSSTETSLSGMFGRFLGSLWRSQAEEPPVLHQHSS